MSMMLSCYRQYLTCYTVLIIPTELYTRTIIYWIPGSSRNMIVFVMGRGLSARRCPARCTICGDSHAASAANVSRRCLGSLVAITALRYGPRRPDAGQADDLRTLHNPHADV